MIQIPSAGLFLCFVRISLLYSLMTGLAIFYGDVQNSMLSIQFFIIQYGLTFIDFLMVLGAKKNIKEFIYVWITTTLLEILILSQQIGTMLRKIKR